MGEPYSDSQKDTCEAAACRKGVSCGCSGMALSASEAGEFRAILAKAVDNIAKLTDTVNTLRNDFAAQIDNEQASLNQSNLEAEESRKERECKVSHKKIRSRGKSRTDESDSDMDSIFGSGLDQK